jgi:glycosyltransferase involved in cell wall biosynthesis
MGKGKEFREAEPSSIRVKAKRKLWVITELYYPEDNQTGYYLTRIAEGLADDFDVKVICGQPNYAARGTKAAKREVHRGVEIQRVWSTTLDKNILPFRLVNMMTLGISMFLKSIIEIGKSEDVLVVSAPPSLPFGTALAAKIRRAEYSLIIQDKYPEILIAVGKSKPDSIFVKTLNRLNRRLYDAAEKIIVVGRDMKELVSSQMSGGADKYGAKITVIQNWAALEEVKPLPRNENPLLEELGLKEKFVFLYAGNMGHPQDLESIVECAERLKSDERFHFLFIGSGAKRKWLEKEVSGKRLVNVTLLEPRPRGEQTAFLNACDVGLVPLVKGMRGVAMPSRTYNFLAAGKPILALTDPESEVATVIEEDRVGWFVPPHAPEQLLDMIYKIYDERDSIGKMGARARQMAIEKYSVEIAIKKFRKAFVANVVRPITEEVYVS